MTNFQGTPLRCGIFSCKGLGDGLIALVLSHNLRLNGHRTTTFHPSLGSMQEWFPFSEIRPFPTEDEQIESFDVFFFIYEKTPWMQALLKMCQQRYPTRTIVLNPIATSNTNYAYWANGRFDGEIPFVDNLYRYCRDLLKLAVVTKSNGIAPPSYVIRNRHPTRIIIHSSSSREGKNWPFEKFIALADRLKEEGWEPVFILTEEERALRNVQAPQFNTLSDVAAYVAESGGMIGNDSGIGHLASCLKIPTLTICRSKASARFWKPAWGQGVVITPSSLIPNLKGLRLRDQHWKKWISVSAVHRRFLSLNLGKNNDRCKIVDHL